MNSMILNPMSTLFRKLTSLLNNQTLSSSVSNSLVLERLYYADGRHNPSHPQHGSFQGLSVLA